VVSATSAGLAEWSGEMGVHTRHRSETARSSPVHYAVARSLWSCLAHLSDTSSSYFFVILVFFFVVFLSFSFVVFFFLVFFSFHLLLVYLVYFLWACYSVRGWSYVPISSLGDPSRAERHTMLVVNLYVLSLFLSLSLSLFLSLSLSLSQTLCEPARPERPLEENA
jgi:hypothetical protein